MKYTYRKSEGEDVWTVGYEQDGEWIPESDWESGYFAIQRADWLNVSPARAALSALDFINIRQAVEEMMNRYRLEAKERNPDAYWRGAADACANILDLPEMKLFLRPGNP